MIAHMLVRRLGLVALMSFGLCGFSSLAGAQNATPSPASIALAKEYVTLKGAHNVFDPVVPGVIENAKNMLMQTNPNLGKDLTDVAAQLRAELAPKRDELINNIATLYAKKFSDQELKDLIAFYKSPLGKKLQTDDPIVVDQSMNLAQNWANRFSEEVIVRIRAEMKKKGHDL